MLEIITIPKDSYLYIKSSGIQDSLLAHKEHAKAIFGEIQKHQYDKVLYDELDVNFQAKFSDLVHLLDAYNEDAPNIPEMKFAAVLQFEHRDLGVFWESSMRRHGYNFRLFHSVAGADKWLRGREF